VLSSSPSVILGRAGSRSPLRLGLALVVLLVAFALAVPAAANEASVRLLPTVAAAGVEHGQLLPPGSEAGRLRAPRGVGRVAHQVDNAVAEALQDLGMSLEVSSRAVQKPYPVRDAELVHLAHNAWVVAPVVVGGDTETFTLRLAVVPSGSEIVFSLTRAMVHAELEVKVALMVRDLLRAAKWEEARLQEAPQAAALSSSGLHSRRSEGRAILALHAALLGGYTGFALQRASGSGDARLVYPLAALGAGVGLGAAIVIADEWDVSNAEAWYLSAGAIWPNVASVFLAEAYGSSLGDRHMWGLLGSSLGLSLGGFAVASGAVREGDAALAHSGAVVGLSLGGMTEFVIEGRTGFRPSRGLGFGAIAGLFAGGALGLFAEAEPERVLMVDVGIALGALGGAAALSPLLLVEPEASPRRTRLWISGVGLGMAAGGAVAWWATSPGAKAATGGASVGPYAAPLLDAEGWSAGLAGRW
jgi:hypothetical protein